MQTHGNGLDSAGLAGYCLWADDLAGRTVIAVLALDRDLPRLRRHQRHRRRRRHVVLRLARVHVALGRDYTRRISL